MSYCCARFVVKCSIRKPFNRRNRDSVRSHQIIIIGKGRTLIDDADSLSASLAASAANVDNIRVGVALTSRSALTLACNCSLRNCSPR